jgi:hypothetical protein
VTKEGTTPDGTKKKRITLWVYLEDVEQLQALARQRRRQDWSELAREALHEGTTFTAIKGEPDRASGRFGNLDETDLAELVYLLTGQGIMWLERHGTPIASPSEKVLALVEAFLRSGSSAGAAAPGKTRATDNQGEAGQKQARQPLILGTSDGPPDNDSFMV